jgi:hypothetical protein
MELSSLFGHCAAKAPANARAIKLPITVRDQLPIFAPIALAVDHELLTDWTLFYKLWMAGFVVVDAGLTDASLRTLVATRAAPRSWSGHAFAV